MSVDWQERRKRFYAWSRRIDWRVRVIIAATLISLVVTAIIYFSGYGRNPATHFGAIFASWVSGVALFVVLGAAGVIVSLVHPEQESFDARARILFRRQTGRHIDYIVERIKDILEHYAECSTIKVSVRAFDSNENKFRVMVTTSIVVRSYLDDVSTTYTTGVHYSEATQPPPGGEPNRLLYVRVGGAPVGISEDFDPTGSLSRPLSTTIDMDTDVTVEYCAQFWVAGNTEAISHYPRRYTQLLKLEVENLVNFNQPLELSLTKREGTEGDTLHLRHGESRLVWEASDIKPETLGYELRLHVP